MWGTLTPYRYYYAQKRAGISFGLAPIAVSGLIECEGQLIFARRSPQVTTYAGFWELVPSGGVDRAAVRDDGSVDIGAALRQEFVEEVGLNSSVIENLTPFALVYDPAEPTYDVACRIVLKVNTATVLESLAHSPEYTQALAVPWKDLPAWLQENNANLIPTSRLILEESHAG